MKERCSSDCTMFSQISVIRKGNTSDLTDPLPVDCLPNSWSELRMEVLLFLASVAASSLYSALGDLWVTFCAFRSANTITGAVVLSKATGSMTVSGLFVTFFRIDFVFCCRLC